MKNIGDVLQIVAKVVMVFWIFALQKIMDFEPVCEKMEENIAKQHIIY